MLGLAAATVLSKVTWLLGQAHMGAIQPLGLADLIQADVQQDNIRFFASSRFEGLFYSPLLYFSSFTRASPAR